MICPHCQRDFVPNRPDQRYCCAAHRIAHYAATRGDGGLRAPVRTVKRLGDGSCSVTLRFAAQDCGNAFQLVPGQLIEVIPR